MTDNSAPFDKDDFRDDIAEDTPVTPAAQASTTPPPLEPARSNTRRRAFLILGIVILIAAAIWLFRWATAAPSQSTDDAYVGGNVVSVTAREGGTVLAIHADNTQHVTRGAPLIDLDPAVADVNLASAEAELGRAVRTIRANQSSVLEAGAEIVQARANLAKAQDDLRRRKGAAAQGAVSGEELSHAQDAVTTASAALNLAVARQAEAASAVAGVTVANNPAVLAAIANVRNAAIMRAHMNIVSPAAGTVAQRTVQLGQRIAAGTPLMAVVPMDSLWVDANFRETQLRDLRVGQPATIKADVYGGKIVFHGKVLGLGAGSGNAFALLPPQNATGNWIKIVQRVPVRIALDPKELASHPLRVGLSVTANVDTSVTSGPLVAGSAAPAGGIEQSVDGGPQIEATIRRIIAENEGTTASGAGR